MHLHHGVFLGDEVVEVQVPGGDQQETLVRRRTAGVLDMGGVSTQIAYEVPKTVSFASQKQVIIYNNFYSYSQKLGLVTDMLSSCLCGTWLSYLTLPCGPRRPVVLRLWVKICLPCGGCV